jgi:hypothetical protein
MQQIAPSFIWDIIVIVSLVIQSVSDAALLQKLLHFKAYQLSTVQGFEWWIVWAP